MTPTSSKDQILVDMIQRVDAWRIATRSTTVPLHDFTGMGERNNIRVYMRTTLEGSLSVRFAGVGVLAKTDTMLKPSTVKQLVELFGAFRLPANITSLDFGHLITTQFQAARPAAELPALQAEDQLDITYNAVATKAWFNLP